MHTKIAKLVTLITLTFLGSCAQFGPQTTTSINNNLPTNWLSSGKLAVTLPPNNDPAYKKNQVLRFKWQQRDTAFSLRLSGAFGFGALTINQEANKHVVLLRGGKVIGRAKDAETLLYQHTGFSLPISLLRHWIVGQPDITIPHAISDNADNNSKLNDFEQQNWRINYTGITSIDNYLLPKKISATNGEIILKAIISQWDIIN